MSQKIKEFIDIRDMHYLRTSKSSANLSLRVVESKESFLAQETQFAAHLKIGASLYVPRGGFGEQSSWEIARERLGIALHHEIFSEIYPWIDSFMGRVHSDEGMDYNTRTLIYTSINELNDIVRWKK